MQADASLARSASNSKPLSVTITEGHLCLGKGPPKKIVVPAALH